MSMRKLGIIAAGAAVAWAGLVMPAWAHVQVEATPGAPGATDATLKITAAGESATAGISKLDVTADPAIPADQVTLSDGPTGWAVSPGSSGGFALSGPALPKGQDAEISLKVKQLPNVAQITFKVVQTYSDGDVERWIELPGPDGKEPDKPAPVVKLSAGAASSISPKPAGDNDEDKGAAAGAGSGSLARTGAGDRSLAAAAGLLLLAGGWSMLAGAGRQRISTTP
ncbi:MAG: YcnI family protein [Actinobacteria bacterium]|nr:YcnI family protein [Actinomycetota bacterium]